MPDLVNRILLWAITGLIGWTLWSTEQNAEKIGEIAVREQDILVRLHDAEQVFRTEEELLSHCIGIWKKEEK